MIPDEVLIRAATHLQQIRENAIRPGDFADLVSQIDQVLNIYVRYLDQLFTDGQPTQLSGEWETAVITPFERFVAEVSDLENMLSLTIDESVNTGRLEAASGVETIRIVGHVLPAIAPEYQVRVLSALLLFTKTFFMSSTLDMTEAASAAEQAIAIMYASSVGMTRPELAAMLSERAQDAVSRGANIAVPAGLPERLRSVLSRAIVIDVSAALSNNYASYGAALINLVRLQADGDTAVACLRRMQNFLGSSEVRPLPTEHSYNFDDSFTYASVIAETEKWRSFGFWIDILTTDERQYALHLPQDFTCFCESPTRARFAEYTANPMLYTLRYASERASSSRVRSCDRTTAKIRQLEADLLADRKLRALNEQYLLALISAQGMTADAISQVRAAAQSRNLTDPAELVKTAAITYFVFDALGDPSPGREAIAGTLIRALSDLTSRGRGPANSC